MPTTYDVFAAGGDYGWRSIGRAQSAETAAELAGHPVELRTEIVHSYQDKQPLGRYGVDIETAHERQVISGTKCLPDAVATLDGIVKDVRIIGWFPAP